MEWNGTWINALNKYYYLPTGKQILSKIIFRSNTGRTPWSLECLRLVLVNNAYLPRKSTFHGNICLPRSSGCGCAHSLSRWGKGAQLRGGIVWLGSEVGRYLKLDRDRYVRCRNLGQTRVPRGTKGVKESPYPFFFLLSIFVSKFSIPPIPRKDSNIPTGYQTGAAIHPNETV